MRATELEKAYDLARKQAQDILNNPSAFQWTPNAHLRLAINDTADRQIDEDVRDSLNRVCAKLTTAILQYG
jgi:hypothetical protein